MFNTIFRAFCNASKNLDDKKLAFKLNSSIRDYNRIHLVPELLSQYKNTETSKLQYINQGNSVINANSSKFTDHQVFKIIKAIGTDSQFKDWLVVLKPRSESLIEKMNTMNKILLLKSYETIGVTLSNIHESIEIEDMTTESFALFINTLTFHPHLKNNYIRKLKTKAKRLSSDPIDEKSLMLIVRGFSILRSPTFMFRFFHQHILRLLYKLSPSQLSNIIYYVGISHIYDQIFWNRIIKYLHTVIGNFNTEELSLIAKGLFEAKMFEKKLAMEIESILWDNDIDIISAEKLITAYCPYISFKIYRKFKSVFIARFNELPKNKALICIDNFKRARLFDDQMYGIMKNIKNKNT